MWLFIVFYLVFIIHNLRAGAVVQRIVLISFHFVELFGVLELNMKDVSAVEAKFINDMALAKRPKTKISEAIGCSTRTIFNSLHRSFPKDSASKITIRSRKKGNYKATKQILDTIEQFVLHHPYATNREIIQKCLLPTAHKTTVTRWLKQVGIGSYMACRRQGITPINANRRQVHN